MLSKLTLTPLLIFLLVANISAQVFEGGGTPKYKNAKKIWLNEENSTLKFIQFSIPENIPEATHSTWLKSLLDCPSNVDFKLIRKMDDRIGQTHYRYAQYVNGYPLEGAQYIIHAYNGNIISANGEYYNVTSVSSTPNLSEKDAFEIAKKGVVSSKYRWEEEQTNRPQGELVISRKGTTYNLSYKFDIYSLEPFGRYYVFVDASTGKILEKRSRIHNNAVQGTANCLYHGTQTITTDSLSPNNYILYDDTRKVHTWNLNNSSSTGSAVDFTDTDNNWTTTTNQDNAAYDAHWGAEKSYDYFYNRYGLDSYDGLGATINCYVHYGFGVANAFWDGSGMLFGDGDGFSYTALTSVDVVAHELGHAVTEFSAGLIYSYESGALNESFSDIFGVAVDFYANPTTANWYMGDLFDITGNGFRDMADPNVMFHPDTYLGNHWYTGAGDAGGVHTNSGVQNYWFYLLSMGGVGVNDNGDTYSVDSLGVDAAGAIAYRNVAVYLTPSSQYIDARFYAIQAAVDLYGACSPEEIATTDAWYAVGLGTSYGNSVVSNFVASQTYACSLPASITFNNISVNDSSRIWYFGDGDSSSLYSPIHVYTATGTYPVTLITAGSSVCGSMIDTLVKTSYITVTNVGGPIPAACVPTATTGNPDHGIFNVELNSIINATSGASDGYQDYTCTHNTNVTEGDWINLSVGTGIFNTNVAVYIDYNNDGAFAVSEQVYADYGLGTHSTMINIPAVPVNNTPLRVRVIADYASITSTCWTTLNNSQIEDYSIIIAPLSSPPVADFVGVPTTVNVGSSVTFTNLSSGLPTGYSWSFPGGSPATSTLANPVINYPTLGTYDVQLIATNGFGSDTILKTSYITVTNEVNMCGAISTTTAVTGLLYDSGGSTGNYSNGENCYLLIQPLCADSITLSFSQFNTENGYDYIRIYDGTSTADPLIYQAMGSTLPPDAIATSGSMYIYFHSDGSVIQSGFEASWSTVQHTAIPPVANFSVSDINPPYGVPVTFTDLSTNAPLAWSWSFGDGNVSNLQNPSNAYLSSGTYTIQLIATTCGFSDTISQVINVQAAPIISVNPDTINVTINCSDSAIVPLMVSNIGSGSLVFNTDGLVNNGAGLDVLAWTYAVDTFGEYPNTINAINTYYTNYNLTVSNTTSPAVLQGLLASADVLLIPEQELNVGTVNAAMAATIQAFVLNGGWVVICGTGAATVNQLGVFNITGGNFSSSGTQTIVDAASPLLNNTSPPILNSSAVFYGTFTSPAFNQVTSYLSGSVVGDLDIGSGKAIYIGYDYYSSTPNADRIIANAIEWASTGGAGTSSNWVYATPDSGTVVVGDSMLIDVIINGAGMVAGNYDGSLNIISNDSLNPSLDVPVFLTIIGSPDLGFSANCINYNPTTLQFTTDTGGVWVYNPGCDTLEVTNITTSNADVSPQTTVFNVAPYDSTYLEVYFTPDTLQTYSGLITLFTNAGDSSICFTGGVVGAPYITVNPDTLFVTLTCNDSITVPLEIGNIGTGPLNFDISQSGGGTGGNVNILAWTYAVDTFGEYQNTINGINNYYTNYTLTSSNTSSPAVLQSLLASVDVLLIPEQEFSVNSVNLSMATTIQNFVSAGGWVVICGTDYYKTNDFGIFSMIGGSSTTTGTQTIVDVASPLLNNTVPPILNANATFYATITNPTFNVVTSVFGEAVVGDLNYGLGKAIYIGYDYFASNPNADRIIANAIEWASAGAGSSSDWISASPDSGTVAASDSMFIDVTVNGTGMVAGTYDGNLNILSNDPVRTSLDVPVVLTIIGSPDLGFSANCVDFDPTTLQFTTDTGGVWVYNPGCDSLQVNNITTSNADVTLDTTVLTVAPYDSAYLEVYFTPDTLQTYSGQITFFTNAGDSSICFTGGVVGAPHITVNPDTLFVTLSCNDSVTVPLVVGNTGTGPLNFDVSQTGGGTGGNVNVLAWTYGADMFTEYPNTIAAIDAYYTNYTLTTTNTTIASSLQASLAGVDVLLIPEQESGSLSVNSAMASTVQSFVSAGGWVVFCGSDRTKINSFGIFNITSGGFASSGMQTIVDASSPLLNNTVPPILNSSATLYGMFSSPTFNQVTSYLGGTMVGDMNYGSGKAIYIGYDYYGFTPNSQRIIANAIEWASTGGGTSSLWISTNPDSGTVAASDSIILDVTIDGTGMVAGTYIGNTNILSNDPVQPSLSVPVVLTIIGAPDIAFGSNCVVFDTTMQFTTDTAGIWVYNPGCDTLEISNIVPNDLDVVAGISALNIAPNDSAYVNFYFTPDTLQNYSGQITFFTNAGDSSICFTGGVVGAPHITVNPDTLFVTLSCNDSVTVPLVVGNTGTGPLNFDVSQTGGGTGGNVNVLAWTYGADMFTEYPNTIAAIDAYYTNYTLTTTNTTIASSLQASLAGVDVLLIPEQESGSLSVNSAMASTVQSFVSAGGWVVFCGSDRTKINSFGIFNITSGGFASSGMQTIVDAASPLLNNTVPPILNSSATLYGMFSSPTFNQVTSYLGGTMVGDMNYGSGKAIYIGYDYYGFTPNSQRIIANAIEWASTGGGTSSLWISTNPDSGTVAASDSIILDVTVDGTGMVAGTYIGNTNILSNDPVQPSLSVPVVLTIIGSPDIAFGSNCVVFDTTMQFTTDTAGIWVYNPGCDTLEISNIVPNDLDVVAGISALNIAPYDSSYVEFYFTPTLMQTYSGQITFFNNAGDTSICFNGVSVGAPIISVSPDSINVTLNCNDSIVVPVVISNQGAGPLNFDIDLIGGGSGMNVNVLAWTYAVDMTISGEYNNTINAINTYYTNYTLTANNTTSPSVMQGLLAGVDVLLIPEQESTVGSVNLAMASTIQNFVANGGWVIFCGTDRLKINDLGIFNIISSNFSSGGTQTIVDASSPLLNNTTQPITNTNATLYGVFANPGFNEITSYVGNTVLGDMNYGSGKAIYIGYDYYSSNANSQRVIANAIEWASTSVVDWTSISPEVGSVSAGNSMIAYVTISADSLSAGTYQTTYLVNSNDPANPTVSIPVFLTVTNGPNLAVSDSCLNLGMVYQYTPNASSIILANTGCVTMNITGVATSTIELFASPGSTVILPGGTTLLNMVYTPTALGAFNETVTITSNGGDTTICIYGTVDTFTVVSQVGDLDDFVAKLYPNPNDGAFTFSYEGSSSALNLLLLSVSGQRLFERSYDVSRALTVDFKDMNLVGGVYYLQMTADSHVKTLKFIVRE